MVTDSVKNIMLYKNLGERIYKGLQFIKQTDFSKIQDGKYEIEGNDIFASVSSYKTKPLAEGKFEAHRTYIDIQYLIEGTERLYYTQLDKTKELEPYKEENDIVFLSGEGDFVTAIPGTFLIFFPTDAHMPCISADTESYVKKVVIKVKV